MEAMPTVSSSVEKLPQIPHISLTQRHQTIRHPEKCSKPENDAICGLAARLSGQASKVATLPTLEPQGLDLAITASDREISFSLDRVAGHQMIALHYA